jgi:hypothetical protein
MDCLPNDYDGEFRIISKDNGEDLLFGSLRIYNRSELRFYSLNERDTIDYPLQAVNVAGDNYDSIIRVNFYPGNTDLVYLQLNKVDIDTLTNTYRIYNSECCGRITEIVKFRYNDKYDLDGKSVQLITK